MRYASRHCDDIFETTDLRGHSCAECAAVAQLSIDALPPRVQLATFGNRQRVESVPGKKGEETEKEKTFTWCNALDRQTSTSTATDLPHATSLIRGSPPIGTGTSFRCPVLSSQCSPSLDAGRNSLSAHHFQCVSRVTSALAMCTYPTESVSS